MSTPIWTGRCRENATIDLDRPDDLRGYLRQLAGQPIEVVIRRRRAQRSHSQNAYYWGVVIAETAESFGYEPDEMHSAWKLEFLKDHTEDKPFPRIKSTTELSTAEFETYLEQIRRKAAEYGCVVPEPNEVSV